jgi:drug/metabolite transporter (DMT)-like permease
MCLCGICLKPCIFLIVNKLRIYDHHNEHKSFAPDNEQKPIYMKKSYLVLHVDVILSGFTGMLGKLISPNEGLLVWYRLLFTSICLFFITKLFKISRDISLREKFSIGRVGILITIFWLWFYASIKYSNISIGVVCYTLTSLFTAIFDPLLNKKKLVVAELLLSLLPIVGITLIFSFDADYHLGIYLVLFHQLSQ